MRLSEREKKYVLLLAIMLMLAALYFFYTAAVEPYLLQKELNNAEIVQLQLQEQDQQQKIQRLEAVKAEIELKQEEAIAAVQPFYPALPQDRLMLQVQELITKSGLEVSGVLFSGQSLSAPGQPFVVVPPYQYPLKTLSDVALGMMPVAPDNMENPPQADVNPNEQYTILQAQFNLSFTGTHEQVLGFLSETETLGRTITIGALTEAKTTAATQEPGVVDVPDAVSSSDSITGTMNLVFHAVDKPTADPFMEWTLTKGDTKKSLFEERYTEAVEEDVAPLVTP